MNVRRLDKQDEILRTIGPDPDKIPPPAPAPVGRYKGALLGCALGDAVGAWAERRPADEAKDFAKYFIREFDFSKIGTHHHGMRFGQYTDDTQLSRELMLSLIDEHDFMPEDFADRIARIFGHDGIVGYGRATQEAAIRLLDNVPWDEAGTPPPRAGNGAAMRAGPIGLFYYYDVSRCIKAAEQQAIITHKAPMSVAAAVAVAMATAMALSASKATTGPHEPGWWTWLAAHVHRNNEEFAQDIRDLAKICFDGRKTAKWKAGDDDEFAAAAEYVLEGDDASWEGVSPWARSSTLWALYCVMASPFDVWKAIELAVAIGGDSDTIAAMAGTIVGAHIGLDSFPQTAIEEVAPLIHDAKSERYTWEGLESLAETLHGIVESQYQERLSAWEKDQDHQSE
jgi:ADP-ribosylglycohydrolase